MEDAGEALRQAAKEGQVQELSRLLDEDPSIINSRDRSPSQWTPLMTAAYFGQVSAVSLLLDRGASMDLRDAEGATALYLAADRRRGAEVVDLLIDRGANPALKALGGLNALMAASFGGHLRAVRRLLQQGGQHVDERSSYGQTSLWWACANGSAEVAKVLLVEGGADHTIADLRQNMTPCQVAESRGNRACIDVIQWFEQEIGRPYTLHKARCVCEDLAMSDRYPQAPPPRYLRHRTMAGKELPRMELVPPPHDAATGEEREGEMVATIGFVVEGGLNRELYTELMDGLRLK